MASLLSHAIRPTGNLSLVAASSRGPVVVASSSPVVTKPIVTTNQQVSEFSISKRPSLQTADQPTVAEIVGALPAQATAAQKADYYNNLLLSKDALAARNANNRIAPLKGVVKQVLSNPLAAYSPVPTVDQLKAAVAACQAKKAAQQDGADWYWDGGSCKNMSLFELPANALAMRIAACKKTGSGNAWDWDYAQALCRLKADINAQATTPACGDGYAWSSDPTNAAGGSCVPTLTQGGGGFSVGSTWTSPDSGTGASADFPGGTWGPDEMQGHPAEIDADGNPLVTTNSPVVAAIAEVNQGMPTEKKVAIAAVIAGLALALFGS